VDYKIVNKLLTELFAITFTLLLLLLLETVKNLSCHFTAMERKVCSNNHNVAQRTTVNFGVISQLKTCNIM